MEKPQHVIPSFLNCCPGPVTTCPHLSYSLSLSISRQLEVSCGNFEMSFVHYAEISPKFYYLASESCVSVTPATLRATISPLICLCGALLYRGMLRSASTGAGGEVEGPTSAGAWQPRRCLPNTPDYARPDGAATRK